MGSGKRFAVVVNSSAGSANEDGLHDHLRECFEDVTILEFGGDGHGDGQDKGEDKGQDNGHGDSQDNMPGDGPGDGNGPGDGGGDLIGTLRKAATFDIMGIVGGDGSVNAAVGVSIETGTSLAVVPGGTLNHFARDIALESMEETAAAILAGRTAVIDVGLIDGAPFVNTASFGAYPELVDERERRENRLGKWPAMAVAMGKVMRSMTPTEVSINGRRTSVWLFFAGNCRYDPPGLAPLNRQRLDDGQIDLRWIDASVLFGRTRTFLAMLTGPRGRSRAVKTLVGERFEIVSHDGPLRLARDGETFDGGETIVIEKHPQGVEVYVGWAGR